MTGVPYKGRPPDSDFSVVPKKYVDDRYTTIKVDNAYVDGVVATVGATLVTPGYVDSADAPLAKKTAADAADTLYVPNSSKGQPNGVPSLDGSAYIPSGQLGTVQTARKAFGPSSVTYFLTGSRELLLINPKEYKVASLTLNDPGFPYVILAYATIRGGSIAGTQAALDKGTGNYAQFSILRSTDDKKYGWMVTTGQKPLDSHQVIPYGELSSTPVTIPPSVGATTLDLYAGLYGGSTYTINNTSLAFYAVAYPAVA